jgi:hypothetical protein
MTEELSRIRSAHFPVNFHFEYIIVNFSQRNSSADHFWFPTDEFRAMVAHNPEERFHRDSDLAAKFVFALRFFLQNSDAGWFWRGTDDAVVHFQNLPNFVAYLDDKYDPLKEIVVLGNCIDRDEEHGGRVYRGFLQGGSGWVLSRRAAELVERMGWTWVPEIDWADDVIFTRVLERLNLSVFNGTSEFFLGHDAKDWDRFQIENPGGLPVCPRAEERNAVRCRKFTSPLRDLVFWHRQWDQMGPRMDDAEAMFRAPPNVHFWMDASDTRLCLAENSGSK